jgi:hypothetical protein
MFSWYKSKTQSHPTNPVDIAVLRLDSIEFLNPTNPGGGAIKSLSISAGFEEVPLPLGPRE